MAKIILVEQRQIELVESGELSLERIHQDILAMDPQRETIDYFRIIFPEHMHAFYPEDKLLENTVSEATEKIWIPVDLTKEWVGEYTHAEKVAFLLKIIKSGHGGYVRPTHVKHQNGDIYGYADRFDPDLVNPMLLSFINTLGGVQILIRFSIDVKQFLEELPPNTEFRDPPIRQCLRLPRYGNGKEVTAHETEC